ncbi:CHAD domain-containing protein [Jannaschia sp. R86511]|uniref:CYTH and CHAD domain-containing protein n=1 Tax=Jannaschia sp. R86511 TaxID=3093853 RepID=UPI0036D34E96
MTASHLEVETTLEPPEADPTWALPVDRLRDLPGVDRVVEPPPVTLRARYHDTTGLALLRAGLTLRRREGGADAGWHLKLPAEGGRLEQHAPLTAVDGPVPAPLLGLSRSRHRDLPLVVVAQLRTERRTVLLTAADGTVLAEVADDTVAAEVPPAVAADGGTARPGWRELEVELVAGDDDLRRAAVDVLLAAGATTSTHPSKVGRALAAAGAGPRLAPPGPGTPGASGGDGAAAVLLAAVVRHRETLLVQDPLVRLDAPDAVHSMRVACRRLRSLLAAFRPQLDPAVSEPLREELRWLGQVLGGPRDAEVVRARLATRLGELPAGGGDRVWPAPPAAPGAVAALDGARYLQLLAALDGFVADPPVVAHRGRRRGTRRAARHAYRRVARALAAVPAAPGPEQDTAWHEVRKATERLRYTCEAVTTVHGAPARRLARRAEALQERLGEHQDSVLARDVLRGAAGRTDDRDETFLLGTLAGLELASARAVLADLDRPVRRLHRAAARWFD